MLKKINKTYHILVYAQLTTNVSGASSSCTAVFDFGQLPRSRWRVKYYGGFGTANFTTNQYPQVFVDFGQKYNELGRNSNNTYPSTLKSNNQYVGGLVTYTNRGGACGFNVAGTDNGYFYLDCTPGDNFINITVYNHGLGQALWTPNTNSAIFGFAFEQLDEPIYRSIKNVYNVVFNSDYGESIVTTDNSLGSKRYYFDWSLLPKGEYEVSTSMTTSDDSYQYINYAPFSIFCDLGQGNLTVFTPTNKSNQKVKSSDFLSIVFCEQTGSIGPLVCYRDYSPPVFLNSRPSNNNVNLYINSTYTGQFPYAKPTGSIMNYTLCFTFRWLG